MLSRILLIAGASTLISVSAVADSGLRVYSVGNSLTVQTVGIDINDVSDLAAVRGHTLDSGMHIRPGSSMTKIVASPDDPFYYSPQYGKYRHAFENFTWDAITLQPYYDSMVSGRESIQTFLDLLHTNPTNKATRVYLLSTWPQGQDPNQYAANWTAAYDEVTDSDESRSTFAYAKAMLAHARSDDPSVTFAMIPSAEVLYRLDLLAKAGTITSFGAVADLYGAGDLYHLTPTGAYISKLTLFSTLFKESPYGLPMPEGLTLSEADLHTVQQTVWNVVSTNANLTLVPEPASAFLLGAVLGMARRARRA